MSTTTLVNEPVFTGTIDRHDELLAADVPMMLHMPGILSQRYCDQVAARLRLLSLTPYAATVGSDEYAPIPKLGPALFEFHDDLVADPARGMAKYHSQAEADDALLRALFRESSTIDPLDVLHEIAEALLGQRVSVAMEGPRAYFSGVVRDINGGALPHYDDASVDTPDLTVGKTDRQLSILLYLTDFTGGSLTSYSKKPTAEDNCERQLAYGYQWSAVQGADYEGVVPAKGSVVVFNPRFIHSVAPVLGMDRRLTFSAFIGRVPTTGALISWS